ncbi:PHP domain-containing protein [Peptococcaceae bacterium 1198_IL3148]
MAADLHIHTTISDGTDTPEQIVKQALALGLDAIAITDHDIMDGAIIASRVATGKNITVLSGVEISCYYNTDEVHILGYFDQVVSSELTKTLAEMRNFRWQRAKLIVEKLKHVGINIKWQRIREIAGDGSVGRPHIADALVEKKIVPNRETAFKKYIGTGCPAYVPRKKISPIEAIDLITQSKGVAVLAHPGTINSQFFSQIGQWIKHGLHGIEVWHPHHSVMQSQYFLNQAKALDLIPTGGSDYHGLKHASCNSLGAVTAPMESVERIIELL